MRLFECIVEKIKPKVKPVISQILLLILRLTYVLELTKSWQRDMAKIRAGAWECLKFGGLGLSWPMCRAGRCGNFECDKPASLLRVIGPGKPNLGCRCHRHWHTWKAAQELSGEARKVLGNSCCCRAFCFQVGRCLRGLKGLHFSQTPWPFPRWATSAVKWIWFPLFVR